MLFLQKQIVGLWGSNRWIIEGNKLTYIPFKAIRIESKTDARNAPTPITTYALFCDGEYLTNEQMNDSRFLKLVSP